MTVADDLATPVGMHECATCKRCATTYAIVHPACPKCAERARVEAEIARLKQKLAEGWDEVVAKDKARAIQAEIRLEAAEAEIARLEQERDALEAAVGSDLYFDRAKAAEAEVARLTHLIECADTPLMRDVLADNARLRDGLRAMMPGVLGSELEYLNNAAYHACVHIARALLAEDGFGTDFSAEVAERLAEDGAATGCEYHHIRVNGCRACDALAEDGAASVEMYEGDLPTMDGATTPDAKTKLGTEPEHKALFRRGGAA